MVRGSPAPLSAIVVQILAVRASLYTAVESLERSLEYAAKLPSVAHAAAIVVAQIAELKRLLTLLEQEDATRERVEDGGPDRTRPQPPLRRRRPATRFA
jgi:hypothetical protein